MQTIEFRYNRHKTTFSLIVLLGFFWLLSMFIVIWFTNNILITTDSYGYFTPYWNEHREFALAISVLLPVFALILPVIPVCKLWQILMDAHGKAEIYGNYANLYYGGNELRIDKDTKIDWDYASFGPHGSTTNLHPVLKIYSFQQGKKKYYLSVSHKEGHEKTTWKQRSKQEEVSLTLDTAIGAIMPFTTKNPGNPIYTEPLYIGDILITCGTTLSDIFDNTLYYVDYDSCICVKGVPFASCLVREKENPIHVVGNIGFTDEPGNEEKLSEIVLRKRTIVDGCALNEQIEL